MAAITIEDCLKVVPNRFELALIASYRAKQLMNGSPALYVSEKPEKNTVVALREIGMNLLDIHKIKEEMKNSIKNQELFKKFDDAVAYEDRKESDIENVALGNEVSDDSEDEVEEEDETVTDDDEDYYNNLDTDDVAEDLEDDDLDK